MTTTPTSSSSWTPTLFSSTATGPLPTSPPSSATKTSPQFPTSRAKAASPPSSLSVVASIPTASSRNQSSPAATNSLISGRTGANPQPGDVAVRTLTSLGHTIVNIGAEESREHIANFRSVTGIRASREQISRAVGERVFLKMAADRGLLIAAYDNALLGCLYEKIFHEPFAPDAKGTPLGGSLTWPELTSALATIRDEKLLAELRTRFALSRQNLLRLASREQVTLDTAVVTIPIAE